jgi:hypothetical protein
MPETAAAATGRWGVAEPGQSCIPQTGFGPQNAAALRVQ